MPSDIDALTAEKRARTNADARALSAFEPELAEPTMSRTTRAAQADALDLFPREESSISLPRSSSGRVTAMTVPVHSESPQPLAPFIARLVGLALIGLLVGLWSSTRWADNATSVPGDVAPPPDGVSAPPAPTPDPEPPGVVAMREDVRTQLVPPHPAVASTPADRPRAETRPRTVESREALPREPASATRPSGARGPAMTQRLPEKPPTASPPPQPSTTTPVSVAEPASTTPAPANQRDPGDAPMPMNPPAPTPADTPVSAPPGLPSATATAAPPAPAPAVARETADIRAALTRYAVAFSDLDPAAVRAVWPNVDSRALTRAFRGLQQQAIVFDRCDISATGTSAAASCDGAVRYVTRIGSSDPRTERRRWQFRMRKVAERWVIESVDSR